MPPNSFGNQPLFELQEARFQGAGSFCDKVLPGITYMCAAHILSREWALLAKGFRKMSLVSTLLQACKTSSERALILSGADSSSKD